MDEEQAPHVLGETSFCIHQVVSSWTPLWGHLEHEAHDSLVAQMSLMTVLHQVCHAHEQGRTLVCAPGRDPAAEVLLQYFFLALLGHFHFLCLSLQTR